MLPSRNRLKRNKDFEKVFEKGKGYKQDFLYLKFIDNSFNFTRFGFIISKKACKKAVERNKIKRQLREIVRKKLGNIKKGKDVVIVVLQKTENINFQKIKDVIDNIFIKARIID